MNSYLRIFQSIVHLELYIPENHIVASVFNLFRLTSDLNSWTSNFLVTHGDQYIDVGRFMLVLIRVAPGPNNALTIAAYSGQKDSSCSF